MEREDKQQRLWALVEVAIIEADTLGYTDVTRKLRAASDGVRKRFDVSDEDDEAEWEQMMEDWVELIEREVIAPEEEKSR